MREAPPSGGRTQSGARAAAGIAPSPIRVIAVAASLGGPAALSELLTRLPIDCAPVVVVQHIPQFFVQGLAARLAQRCRRDVALARGGQVLERGQVRIAGIGSVDDPRDVVVRDDGGTLVLATPPSTTKFRPSADVLFYSIAEACGARAIGCVLTGMGNDGAHGLLAMRHAGARTYAESEASCAVYGMPRAAVALGAADPAPLAALPALLTA